MTKSASLRFRILGTVVCVGLSAVGAGLRADDVEDIVVTEIMYNSSSGDRNEDYIELYNKGTQAYDLLDYQFTSGIAFTFPSIIIEPDSYLVVCANQTLIRQIHAITNTVGDWDPETSLDNGGERIKLVNASGIEVEDLTYDDRTPWPILADGYGRSLERRNPSYDNDNPANWTAAAVGSWTTVTITKPATSSTLYLYLLGAGTAYVDDVRLYPVGNPGDERIQNGGFETGLGPWSATGTHSGSTSSTEAPRSGTRSLRIVATGAGSSRSNSVYQEDLGLVEGDSYTLELQALLTNPADTLVARLSGSNQDIQFYKETRGGGGTPGKRNTAWATDIPPFVHPGFTSPEAPVPSSVVTLLAQVQDDLGVASVTAHWNSGTGDQTGEMFDDGAHADGAAGDGLYGRSIGSFAAGTIVRYWFTARDTLDQEGRYPFAGNPTVTLGFYVEPAGIAPGFAARSNSGLESPLPAVYHLIIDTDELTGNPPHLDGDLTHYREATFVYNGEVFDQVRVRHRGQSSLGTPKKHWKVDFNKDHRFRTPFADHSEVDNINIQSCYGDKSFLREWLSYKAWMDIDRPGLEAWHVRLYLNGAYRGLYLHLENADQDWMDRTGLDKEGWLWKSYSEAKGGTNGFELEESAGRSADAFAALGDFISKMNSLTGQALVDYIDTAVDVPCFIDFLVIHQLIANADHPAKNYFVWADEDQPLGSWTYYGWDMDLTHGRNFEIVNTTTGQPGITYGNGTGVYNDTIRYDQFGDPLLLFGTSARPKNDGPWNGVINAFLQKTTVYRPAYYARARDLLDQLYHPDVLLPLIDELSGPLAAEIELDWNRNAPYGLRSTSEFHKDKLKEWVVDRYDYLSTALSSLVAPDVDQLACQRSGANAVLSWRVNGAYDAIRVYRSGTLIDTLPGSATGTTQPLDFSRTTNNFKVASVYDGVERTGRTCSVVTTGGGYTTVLSSSFSPAEPASVLAVNCGATQVDGVLQLTEPAESLAGSAFFLEPQPLEDFIAEFDVRFDEPSDPGADGLVFILNTGTQTDICGAVGGGMGYLTGDGGTPVFPGYAVVLDTWQNDGEPSHNWAGFIDVEAGSAAAVAVDVPEEFAGGGSFRAKLVGQDGTFTFSLSNSSIGMAEREVFSYTAPGFAAESAYFGFSAGTGGAYARHLVDNFVLQINSGTVPLAASFTASPRSGLIPLVTQFTNTSTGATSYLWDFGDGNTSAQVNPSHAYSNPGSYTVKLTASGPSGSDVHTEAGYITTYEPAQASFVATPTIGQAPVLVSFSSQSTGAESWAWTFGDGGTSTLENPTHGYTSAGQYTVKLTVTDRGGGTDTMTRTNYIQVDGILDADFSAAVRTGEAPLQVAFINTSVAFAMTSVLWDFGDGGSSLEEHPTHVYAEIGSYTVSLRIFGYSARDTETKTAYIVVGSPEASFVRGDVNGDSNIDISDPVSTLNYLFLGGQALDCLDAADADDNGALELTDAVRLLVFLFQGGSEPAPPYPSEGIDPTIDSLAPCGR